MRLLGRTDWLARWEELPNLLSREGAPGNMIGLRHVDFKMLPSGNIEVFLNGT